jgi:hypothetical protein
VALLTDGHASQLQRLIDLDRHKNVVVNLELRIRLISAMYAKAESYCNVIFGSLRWFVLLIAADKTVPYGMAGFLVCSLDTNFDCHVWNVRSK